MATSEGNNEPSKNSGNSTTQRFAERLHEGVDKAAEKGERLEERLHEGRVNLDEEARRINAGVMRIVRKSPWLALGGTIAVGFLLGAISRRR
jgi:ElaB/YqjD/DUF883 family membrane-anchored ribosome-binding protein